MKFHFFALGMLLLSSPAFCQQENKASSVFLELGGNALIYSLNYERRFSQSEKGLGGRIGFGYVPGIGHGSRPSLILPVGFNYLVGNNHYLEVGAGTTFEFVQGYSSEKYVYFIPSAGYRYQPLTKSFSFRIFFSPVFGKYSTEYNANGQAIKKTKMVPWGGLSFGFRF